MSFTLASIEPVVDASPMAVPVPFPFEPATGPAFVPAPVPVFVLVPVPVFVPLPGPAFVPVPSPAFVPVPVPVLVPVALPVCADEPDSPALPPDPVELSEPPSRARPPQAQAASINAALQAERDFIRRPRSLAWAAVHTPPSPLRDPGDHQVSHRASTRVLTIFFNPG
jgi:hypothetical protein